MSRERCTHMCVFCVLVNSSMFKNLVLVCWVGSSKKQVQNYGQCRVNGRVKKSRIWCWWCGSMVQNNGKCRAYVQKKVCLYEFGWLVVVQKKKQVQKYGQTQPCCVLVKHNKNVSRFFCCLVGGVVVKKKKYMCNVA